jgi:hypothetical protein
MMMNDYPGDAVADMEANAEHRATLPVRGLGSLLRAAKVWRWSRTRYCPTCGLSPVRIDGTIFCCTNRHRWRVKLPRV